MKRSMNIYLLCAVFLLLLLSFSYKEGFQDGNISGALTSMSIFNTKLTKLQTTVGEFNKMDLNLDAQSKLEPLLHPNTDTTYASTVVQQVELINDRMTDYQHDIIALTHAIQGIQFIPVQFKDSTMTLNDAITKMFTDSSNITKQLNQIIG